MIFLWFVVEHIYLHEFDHNLRSCRRLNDNYIVKEIIPAGLSSAMFRLVNYDNSGRHDGYGLMEIHICDLPGLVNIQKAIEHGHRNSGFSH